MQRYNKPGGECHFGILLTGAKGILFPQCRFPRLAHADPLLYVLVSQRDDNRRFNLFGGGRDYEDTDHGPRDLSGIATLQREVLEEGGPDLRYAIVGQVGDPQYVEQEQKHDYCFGHLLLHTGGNVLPMTNETVDHARLTADPFLAETTTVNGKILGGVRHYSSLPYVPGKTEALGRTEKMIQLGLSLCRIPYFHEDIPACFRGSLPRALHPLDELMLLQPSDHIRVFAREGWLIQRTSRSVTAWHLIDPQPIINARKLP